VSALQRGGVINTRVPDDMNRLTAALKQATRQVKDGVSQVIYRVLKDQYA